jgi:hypothetical protein
MTLRQHHHKTIACSLLGLFTYALFYTGMHQLNNPAQLAKECALVDHHLHQNPERHSCDLCDYHLKIEFTDYPVTLPELFTKSFLPVVQPEAVYLKLYNLSSLRAPPVG